MRARRVSILCAAMVVAVLGVGLVLQSRADQKPGQEWSQFRGPSGLGASAEKDLPVKWGKDENIVWKAELPGPGTSTPVFSGDRIFLTSYSGYNVPGKTGGDMEDLKRHVICLNRADGKVRWQKEVESKLPEQATIRDGHGYASSTPAVDGERVYTFFGKSGVVVFDDSGKQLWQADVGSRLNPWGSAASPVLYENLVIINASVESASMIAFDKKSGKEAWRVKGINDSWNTPILARTDEGKTELVVAIQGKVLGFDPATGEALWNCATDIGWYMVPSLVADKGIVYCLGGRSGVAALAVRAGGRGDVTASHRLWTGKKGSNVSSPVFHDGHLYWMNDQLGIAYCAEGKTGKILYEERLSRAGQIYASATLAGGNVYYVSRDGKTYVIAAEPKFKQVAVNDLNDSSTFNAGISVADGRLYLRSDKALYCIGSKSR